VRFSEAFGVERSAIDDWFDPHLKIDTILFIDPLLLLESGGEWADAHEELIAHFVHCYGLVAKATSPSSVSAKAARRLLTFPEPFELGLGYTASGTSGSGSGDRFAERMADGIAVAISHGLDHPEHIEEIGILNEGIGADRISDATANVIKGRLIAYTQKVARFHGIRLEPHKVRHARVSLDAARWHDDIVDLPTNPTSGRPIILVPERLLNRLPTLNANDWFDSHFNDDIRLSLNLMVGQAVTKANIVNWARLHPDRVRGWAEAQTSREDLRSYDFAADPLGVVQWDREPARFAAEHPLPSRVVASHSDLVELVAEVIRRFQHFVEEQRGWSLLWNDDATEKPEEAVQLLFLGIAQQYLRQFDVELDREVELGRGPVDFKASSGTSARLLIEVKKLHNGKFWNGLQHQLPSYLKSDDAHEGWFISVQYRSNRGAADRLKSLPDEVSILSQKIGKRIHHSAVDARRPLSASKIRNDDVLASDEDPLVPARATPDLSGPAGIRTARIESHSRSIDRFDADREPDERYEYLCPCGEGTILEEHENVLGFQEHDVRIHCERCRTKWRFVGGLSVQQWLIEPVPTTVVN
jgi:ribosomal protein S27AE